MKRICAVAMTIVLMAVLVACGAGNNQGAMADGVYTAQTDDGTVEGVGNGWRDTLVLTYEGGAVTNAVFESYDADGNKKSALAEYGTAQLPAVWMAEIAQNVANAAAPEDVDIVAGATSASNVAKALYKAILEDGKPGETIEVSVA